MLGMQSTRKLVKIFNSARQTAKPVLTLALAVVSSPILKLSMVQIPSLRMNQTDPFTSNK